MPTPSPVSGIIVAGGASRRLGHDKRRLRLWGAEGPTLLGHTLAVLRPLCAELIVVLNDPEAWADLPARLVGDAYPDSGALGGIVSGLEASAHAVAIVVAADLPLLNGDLLAAMVGMLGDADALLPRSPAPGRARNGQDLEPLHALYRRSCREPLAQALRAGERRIIAALAGLRVRTPDLDELRPYDRNGHSFININTPDDLARVLETIGHA